MKKLSLKVEELSVATFEVAAGQKQDGTVQAFAATQGHNYTCDPAVGTCFGYTCYATCVC
ncbi:MAG TPA: hypothetical protein VF541_11150 [Longimicrobium sp.]|jgi:hypothetical protein